MFEQSILARASSAKRLWTASLGVSGQVLLVAAMVVAPMLYPEAMPRAAFTLLVPHAPPGRPRQDKEAARQHHETRPVRPFRIDDGLVHRPRFIPVDVPQINDGPVAINAGPWVPGGLEGPGVQGGDPLIRDLFNARPEIEQMPRPTLHPVEPRRAEPAPVPLLKVGGIVKDPVLVHRVDPRYPDIARRAGVSGMVRLTGIIGTDGRIRGLTVQSGNPLLIQAAVDAVRQWVYQPTLLNGHPVEVIDEIVVTFTLNR